MRIFGIIINIILIMLGIGMIVSAALTKSGTDMTMGLIIGIADLAWGFPNLYYWVTGEWR